MPRRVRLFGSLGHLESDQDLDLVLLNTVRVARLVTPVMERQGGGSIVNCSSITGLVGCPPEILRDGQQHFFHHSRTHPVLETAMNGLVFAVSLGQILPGSARWNAFWNAWPQMAVSREHWLQETSKLCFGPVYNKFLNDRGLTV